MALREELITTFIEKNGGKEDNAINYLLSKSTCSAEEIVGAFLFSNQASSVYDIYQNVLNGAADNKISFLSDAELKEDVITLLLGTAVEEQEKMDLQAYLNCVFEDEDFVINKNEE